MSDVCFVFCFAYVSYIDYVGFTKLSTLLPYGVKPAELLFSDMAPCGRLGVGFSTVN